MSALEQEIIEKLHQLQPNAQRRILAVIEQELTSEAPPFDYEAWFQEVEALRQQIRTSHGDLLPDIDVVGMLRDLRDGEDE
jgi:hypothetical protein